MSREEKTKRDQKSGASCWCHVSVTVFVLRLMVEKVFVLKGNLFCRTCVQNRDFFLMKDITDGFISPFCYISMLWAFSTRCCYTGANPEHPNALTHSGRTVYTYSAHRNKCTRPILLQTQALWFPPDSNFQCLRQKEEPVIPLSCGKKVSEFMSCLKLTTTAHFLKLTMQDC